ncbi:hypothetical protein DsansV1_C26g0190161 [Dioscorea sansibarensis]
MEMKLFEPQQHPKSDICLEFLDLSHEHVKDSTMHGLATQYCNWEYAQSLLIFMILDGSCHTDATKCKFVLDNSGNQNFLMM